PPLALVDLALILAIGVAILLRFWNTAYWPYDNYDEFWVYGYNAKIFTMQSAIPSSIGYYPQLLPLSLAYGQVMWGSLNEHAARAIVPYLGMGSILIAYVLGTRLFGRRAGLIGAAGWALYTHAAGWAQYADLEVPVTMYFTGAATFVIVAWQAQDSRLRTRYAILAGVLAGAALWTKPTAGALLESAALIGGVIVVRALRPSPPAPLPLAGEGSRQYTASSSPIQWESGSGGEGIRLHSVLHALLATPLPLFVLTLLPMGGMWYVRNVLFGLPPLVFPAGYWQDAAQRSGQELGWPLLTIALLTLLLLRAQELQWRDKRGLLGGLIVIFVGALPSAIDVHRLTVLEFSVIGVGAALWAWSARTWWRGLPQPSRTRILLIYAFILPYFVTWFWSYSYHYRLSFAFVPLFAVQIGAILDRFWSPIVAGKRFRMALVSAGVLIAALPGWVAALSAWGFALTGALPDDHAKQAIANPALMNLVDYLEAHHPTDRPLRVEASAELRLPFFFPTDDIRTTDYPTRLDQIADVDYFIDSSVGQRLYFINGLAYNQILASLTRDTVLKRQTTWDDGDFRFSVYTVDNQARFTAPKPNGPILNTQIGYFARLAGYDLSTLKNAAGSRIFLTLYWQAIKPSDIDYSVYIHLWDAQAQKLGGVWGGEPVSGAFSVWQNVPGTHFNDPYHTRLWQAGEYVKDEWVLDIPKDTPPGQYELRVGLFDSIGGKRLPVLVNGQPAGDGVVLNTFTVTAP
ncbi:MAG: ArnT family glycosyltransferase, partial [Aggregatilineales bacterium]